MAISADQAASAALFDLLDGHLDGIPRLQRRTRKSSAPVAIIGDMDSEQIGFGDDPDRRISITITLVFAGDSKAPLLAAQGKARELLAGTAVERDGFEITILVDSSSTLTPEDGGGHVGATNLTIFALAQ